jgi:hypothetical protein
VLLIDLLNFGRIYSDFHLVNENHYFPTHLQILKNLQLIDLFNFGRIYSESHLVLEECKLSFFKS